MRNQVLLFINGKPYRVSGEDAFLTVSDFLRHRLKLPGTKIVCSEGDCGSCSVLCGRASLTGFNEFRYLPIDSCIRFMFQLDGCHLVTIEGLAGNPTDADRNSKPTDVQQSMIDCHGSQCGFCTPGFVVAMTGLLETNPRPTVADWRCGLTGNLCRCTGYESIIQAGLQCNSLNRPSVNELYPAASMLAYLRPTQADEILIRSNDDPTVALTIYSPNTIDQVTAFLTENPTAKLVAGATDLGVQFNKGLCQPKIWLDLNRVGELTGIEINEQAIIAGARATWTDFETLTQQRMPQFHQIVSVFGSPQIRHVGTIGGNLINASPIADSLPFLFVCEGELELISRAGRRTVKINDFYRGYKQVDLRPGELLTRVIIPILPRQSELRLYKVSRRKDMDISSFTAAIRLDLEDAMIKSAFIAYGAVGPRVLRLPETESFLKGQLLTEEAMRQAGEIAVTEITPITDVRGGVDYRMQLAKNVLVKFYFETRKELSTSAG